jgi:hypothetical protein
MRVRWLKITSDHLPHQEKENEECFESARERDYEYNEPFCIDCLKEPCTWVHNRQAMRRFDRKNIKRKGMKHLTIDGGKSRRYSLYREMAKIQWGHINTRRQHPLCVEDGIRNIAPEPGKNYIGYVGSHLTF